jgi:hypothetical protein
MYQAGAGAGRGLDRLGGGGGEAWEWLGIGLGTAAVISAGAGAAALIINEQNKNPKHNKASQVVSGQSRVAHRNESAVTKPRFLPKPIV